MVGHLIASVISMDDNPTELTRADLDATLENLMREPRMCACGCGPAQYDVSSRGQVWDLMCVRCFQEVTRDGKVVWVGE